MINDINSIIAAIAKETDYHREAMVWREFIFNIESARTIDAIIKNKKILCAYFGMCPDILRQYCDDCIDQLFPIFVEKFKNDEVEWHEIERFRSYCTDENILSEIDRLSEYAADKNLLNEFIWELNNGGSEAKLLTYLAECKSKEIKTQMLAYLNDQSSAPKPTEQAVTPTSKSTIIGHVNRQCKQVAGSSLLIGYNREHILKQYGLEHLIDEE